MSVVLMSLIIGHRGFSARYLENSMQAFRGALEIGMDGFELDVQPTVDGVPMILHDDDLKRTAVSAGILRNMRSTELPPLVNGEKVPTLHEVLGLEAKLINVELKGKPGWRIALDAVLAAKALDRVLFSSFEHDEILSLLKECPEARCGFLWNYENAMKLTEGKLRSLPPQLMLHPPLRAVAERKELWRPYAHRLAIWGMKSASEAKILGFTPAILITDGP